MTATKSTTGSTQMPESKHLMPFFRTVIMDAGNVCWCSLIFAKVFHDAHKLCSRQDAPLISYILIAQGIKNAVAHIIKGEDGKFLGF
jgi:hypothetical protein